MIGEPFKGGVQDIVCLSLCSPQGYSHSDPGLVGTRDDVVSNENHAVTSLLTALSLLFSFNIHSPSWLTYSTL